MYLGLKAGNRACRGTARQCDTQARTHHFLLHGRQCTYKLIHAWLPAARYAIELCHAGLPCMHVRTGPAQAPPVEDSASGGPPPLPPLLLLAVAPRLGADSPRVGHVLVVIVLRDGVGDAGKQVVGGDVAQRVHYLPHALGTAGRAVAAGCGRRPCAGIHMYLVWETITCCTSC